MDAVTDALARVDWLVGTPVDAVQRLYERSELVRLPNREVLYASGEPADRLFVMLEGRVGAWRPRYGGEAAGDEDIIWYYISDAALTTLCLENVITAIPYFATMRVLRDDTVVLVVGADALHRLLEESPRTGLEIARHIARRLQGFTEQAVDVAVLDTSRRLAKYLARLAGPDGVTTAMTQTELAARLATSRQSVNSALARFVQRGWMRPAGKGQYLIVDRGALSLYAGETPSSGAELFH